MMEQVFLGGCPSDYQHSENFPRTFHLSRNFCPEVGLALGFLLHKTQSPSPRDFFTSVVKPEPN
jgi:hypothetical protein